MLTDSVTKNCPENPVIKKSKYWNITCDKKKKEEFLFFTGQT